MNQLRAAFILGLGLIWVALAQTLYVIKNAETEQASEMISLARELTYADSVLDLEILRLRSGIVEHYDDVTDAYDHLLQNLHDLEVKVKAMQVKQNNLPESLESLDQHVSAKLILVETIKTQNSILRNSEGYLPNLLGEFAKDGPSRNTALAIHGLLLKTLVWSDQGAAESLKSQLDLLSPSRNYSDDLHSIKTRLAMHGMKTLLTRENLEPELIEYFKIPVRKDIDALTRIFTEEQKARDFVGELFRTVLYVSIFGFVLLTAYIVMKFLQLSKKLRDEERVFVLQTLAHEVRTPATGIVLSTEAMRDSFDSFTEDVQDSYLRLCNDAQRLQRVIATTTRYLRAEQDVERINIQKLDSVNDFLNSILEDYEGKVRLEVSKRDGSFSTDFQWLQVCVTNLVDNALNHGKGLVTVQAAWTDSKLEIRVRDAGENMDLDLNKVTKPFAKSGKSKGLGLGLTIVKQVAVLLKGRLTYEGPPTTFILTLSNWN